MPKPETQKKSEHKEPRLIGDSLEGEVVGPSGPTEQPSRETEVGQSSKAVTPGGSILPGKEADVRQCGDVVIYEEA